MSVKRVPAFVRVLPLISALASTIAVAQQPGRWPDDIESLLFEFLSQIPGKTFPSLEVRCTEHTCLAVFFPTGDASSVLGKDELFSLHEKGWNVVSAGTAVSFDSATGARKGFVHFSNDERVPGFPIPMRPPPRFVPLVESHPVAADSAVSSHPQFSAEVFVYSTYFEADGMRFESIEQLRAYLLSASNDFLSIQLRDCVAQARVHEVTRMMVEVFSKRGGAQPVNFITTLFEPCP